MNGPSAHPPGGPHRPQRVLVVSQYYDPEPLPKAGELARALQARGHDVRVVTTLPTYPAGRLYPGHRLRLRERYPDLELPPSLR